MITILKTLELILGILISVAYITLAERKIMGRMQRRIGPDKIGRYGLLQPIIDGVKLLIKEIMIPQQVEKIYYIIGPIITFILSIIIIIPIPIFQYNKGILGEQEYSLLYLLIISSFSSYILLYSGWSSNNKYTILGAIRGVGQIIAYEIGIGIIIINVLSLSTSFNLVTITFSQLDFPFFFALWPICILFIISSIAESSRPPFDLTESESELVAGVLTEYGGLTFAFLYLAEYSFILSLSLITSILFFGTTLFTPIIILIFIWVRVALPRIKFDQLIDLGFNKILPITLSYLIWILSLNYIF